MDAPQSIGHGVTISAPHMVMFVFNKRSLKFILTFVFVFLKHAFALEYLRDHMKPGAHVLDVGSGSGYLTACFYRFIQAQGDNPNTRIVGIEHQPELVGISKENLNNDDPQMLKSGKLIIVGK